LAGRNNRKSRKITPNGKITAAETKAAAEDIAEDPKKNKKTAAAAGKSHQLKLSQHPKPSWQPKTTAADNNDWEKPQQTSSSRNNSSS
jgi:hypothetical protein